MLGSARPEQAEAVCNMESLGSTTRQGWGLALILVYFFLFF